MIDTVLKIAVVVLFSLLVGFAVTIFIQFVKGVLHD